MHAVTGGHRVAEVAEVTPELVEAFERLVPQLSSSSPPPVPTSWRRSWPPASVLFVARDRSGRIVGSLTLAIFRVPTGLLAWIEDVVVDESARGPGAGEALVAAALERAAAGGAKSVDLTSRPSREAANRLYLRVGIRAPDHQRLPLELWQLRRFRRLLLVAAAGSVERWTPPAGGCTIDQLT